MVQINKSETFEELLDFDINYVLRNVSVLNILSKENSVLASKISLFVYFETECAFV